MVPSAVAAYPDTSSVVMPQSPYERANAQAALSSPDVLKLYVTFGASANRIIEVVRAYSKRAEAPGLGAGKLSVNLTWARDDLAQLLGEEAATQHLFRARRVFGIVLGSLEKYVRLNAEQMRYNALWGGALSVSIYANGLVLECTVSPPEQGGLIQMLLRRGEATLAFVKLADDSQVADQAQILSKQLAGMAGA